MVMGRAFGCVLVLALVAGMHGCGAEKCKQALVDDATTFIEQHQNCTADADCVVISDYCGTLPRGFCGQLVMNRDGQASPEWASLDHALKDCLPDQCDACGAALTPACRNGSCKGPS